MQNKKTISVLVILISIFAIIASLAGILSEGGNGEYIFKSIHGQAVTIYGKGLYQHMSSDVAIQGIAQDYVTLLLAIPFLLFSLYRSRLGLLSGKFLLAGVLNYIFLTYLFYMNMAMYNSMFLVYVTLTGLSFFGLVLTLISIDTKELPFRFNKSTPVKFIGGFLIFNAISIAMLWLGVIVPPLLDRSIVPATVQHYTTLTVQAFDLSLFLPISFVAGFLLIKKNKFGFLIAPVYLIFLSLLMTALIAKIIAMAMAGVNVFPAIIIIPCIAIVAIVCGVILVKNISKKV
ncbi:MAG: hypothetical protein A2W93_00410 [Bacteroidetes bacterium GWF2_43_63]|nr:MAG: hypothetical protein A2W94_13110 [Bacteroidetes bacterium GWE2_42_42]OFY53867.1 MAG: hypothetical protein A2W93_00410 [Bacteroidetes bacterium GWF2_43_63]HBG69826.1 hypothetical protein [Bacteroidales bacterium]HCB60977.1 hypothetical protein [Bacteroidales bacterium]HCY24533.1 hypothetical protein [Bacteroidales bacterium]